MKGREEVAQIKSRDLRGLFLEKGRHLFFLKENKLPRQYLHKEKYKRKIFFLWFPMSKIGSKINSRIFQGYNKADDGKRSQITKHIFRKCAVSFITERERGKISIRIQSLTKYLI